MSKIEASFWRCIVVESIEQYLHHKILVGYHKVIIQGKLFQRWAHLLHCSVLSLGGNVNTRRMPKPNMGSVFHIKNQWNIIVIGSYYVNYKNYQNLMLLSSSDTKRTLMHNYCLQIPPRENWFQYVRNWNKFSLHFNLDEWIGAFIFLSVRREMEETKCRKGLTKIYTKLHDFKAYIFQQLISPIKGSDRLCKVIELSMQCCRKLL